MQDPSENSDTCKQKSITLRIAVDWRRRQLQPAKEGFCKPGNYETHVPLHFSGTCHGPDEELRVFLHDTGVEATKLGFFPCTVLNLGFDTPEKREFARRVRRYSYIEDDRLEGAEVTNPYIQHHLRREAMLLATSTVVLVAPVSGRPFPFGAADRPADTFRHC